MNTNAILTGPLGVKVILGKDRTEHEVKWMKGHSSLTFAVGEGRLESGDYESGSINLPSNVWRWLFRTQIDLNKRFS